MRILKLKLYVFVCQKFLRLGILFVRFLLCLVFQIVKTTKNETKQIESEIEDYEALSPLLVENARFRN